MTKVKIIARPVIDGARQLSALELNRYRFSTRRTVLTPERLEAMARKQPGKE